MMRRRLTGVVDVQAAQPEGAATPLLHRPRGHSQDAWVVTPGEPHPKEIEPINDKVARGLVAQNYTSAWRQLGTVNGTLYGVWFRASNKSIVWYRTDAFRQADVDPPKTWAELQKAAERIAASGVAPFSIGGADGWTLTDWFENVYLRTAGPDMYDRLARHEIPWTDPSVRKALTILAEVFGRSDWIAGGTGAALQTNHEDAVLQVFREPSKAAMVYEGDFAANVITGNTGPESAKMRTYSPSRS